MILKDKVSLITGGATGIGRASALLFAKEGSKVVIADINDAKGKETAGLIRKAGGEAVFVHTDVTSSADLAAMLKTAVSRFGGLDILFSNAGIAGPGFLEDTTEEAFDRNIAINLKACFFATKLAVPLLVKNGGGCILYTSSGLGIRASPQSLVYSLTKAALIMLTRSLAVQYGPAGIRVNAICPGPVDTTVLHQSMATRPGTTADNIRLVTEQRPLARLGTVDDMAHAALFLVSPENTYVTGVCLPVDGGGAAK